MGNRNKGRLGELVQLFENRRKNDMESGECFIKLSFPFVDEILLPILKAALPEEARLLTLEEVMEHYSLPPVFTDDFSMQLDYLQDIQPLYFEYQPDRPWNAHWLNYDQVANIREGIKSSYGTVIRAWSAKPTDEQMKATPWDAEGTPR